MAQRVAGRPDPGPRPDAVPPHAQQVLLDRIRSRAASTPEVVGLLVLGSLATGTADELSDLDIGLYVTDEALDTFDLRAWLEPISPVAALVTNAYASTVLFRSLIRAEIHFGSLRRAADWSTLAGLVAYPSVERIVLLDRTGALADNVRPIVGRLPDRRATDADRELFALADALLVADACRRRGELARALVALSSAHVPLLRLARLAEGATDEWVAPARRLERDLTEPAYERFARTTASLADEELQGAIGAAWQWGRELAAGVEASELDTQTLELITRRLT
jgi:predicted nucleotidyltransferase